MAAVKSMKRSRRRYTGSASSRSMPPQCSSLSPAARRPSLSVRVAASMRRSTAGKLLWNRAAARASTVSAQGGVAVMRKAPVLPDWAASVARSASPASARIRLACLTTVSPSGVIRTPSGSRSNSRPPKRASSLAMSRVAAFNGLSWAGNEISLNSGADTTGPTLESATGVGRVLTLTYDEPLDGTSVPPASDFQVRIKTRR